MSKSEDGFITLSTVIKKNINPLALRYLILSGTFRTTLDFSWASLDSSMTTLIRLYRHFSALGKNTGKTSAIYRQKFLRAVNDDLNTPQATALMWDMLKDASLSDQDKKATLIDFDLLLGLDIQNQAKMISHNDTNIPEEIQTLLKKREEARNNKDWKKSDEFRLEIEGKGYEVIDSQEGVRVRKI
jgi:cysteinyl-tRNA synthetase